MDQFRGYNKRASNLGGSTNQQRIPCNINQNTSNFQGYNVGMTQNNAPGSNMFGGYEQTDRNTNIYQSGGYGQTDRNTNTYQSGAYDQTNRNTNIYQSGGYSEQNMHFVQHNTNVNIDRSEQNIQHNFNQQGDYVQHSINNPQSNYFQNNTNQFGFQNPNQFAHYSQHVNLNVNTNQVLKSQQYVNESVNTNQFSNYNHTENPNQFTSQNVNQNIVYIEDNTAQRSGYIQPSTSKLNPINEYQSKDNSNVEENSDEILIKKFTSKIKETAPPTTKKQKTGNSINVCTTKSQIRQYCQLLERIKSIRSNLDENIMTLSSEDWNVKTSEINTHVSELKSLNEHFNDMRQLKRMINKRLRKRALRRERLNLEKSKMLQENARKHKEIDQWLENMRDNVERVKSEENMKKDADCVLAEVTKKKSDGKKQTTLIEALIKLRGVREKVALNRGEKLCTEDSVAFEKTCDKLKSIWDKSMQVYAKEEQGLRIMLEQGDENERKKRKHTGKEAVIFKKWENVLFGEDLKSNSALYWGLTQAERDFESFVAIRKSWDTFLCNQQDENGSGIPIGWVLPNSKPNDDWKNYLKC